MPVAVDIEFWPFSARFAAGEAASVAAVQVKALAGGTHVGDLKAPSLSDLPTNGVVPNPNVLSGTLPTIKG